MELGLIGLGRMRQIIVDRTLAACHHLPCFYVDTSARTAVRHAVAHPAPPTHPTPRHTACGLIAGRHVPTCPPV